MSSAEAQKKINPSDDKWFNPPRIGYEDMTTMENMTLDGVLANLKDRYVEDLIYTYTSSILVAINPYKRLPIYTPKHVKKYKGVRLGKLPPHVFAIAETAYSQMINMDKNQSVLVSGESGAGKTETTKLILQFLSARTARASPVEKMVLASVPVLEAMGNAKTGRNDNSSRFGKLIKIQFDTDRYICGSIMEHYLLEKSRLCFQAPGERNFHIFYQMTLGFSAEEKAKYFLKEANYYNYINKSGCLTVDGVDESESLQEFRDALKLFDISPELEDKMFRILASVLHLGNVNFKGDDKADWANADSEQQAKNIANLLGIKFEAIKFGLLNKKIKMRNEIIDKPLNAEQCREQADALAKHLYSLLFDWLVSQLNVCTHAEEFKSFIGVLDIFGFELFQKNSLEQFLINYANEKLQQFFNHQIFKLEQRIYEEEQIDWTVIEFVDNQECLDLIEQRRPPGILSILDEECKFPRATDATLLAKLHENFENKHRYYDKPRLSRTLFGVKHFAGLVEYDVGGWRDKNKDEVPEHLIDMLSDSSDMFVAILYGPEDLPVEEKSSRARSSSTAKAPTPKPGTGGASSSSAAAAPASPRSGGAAPASPRGGPGGAAGGAAGAKGASSSTASSKLTVGQQFKTQLQSLMDLLSQTEPYFIRCVKPNPQKVPDKFDQKLIYDQLLYAGMLETIRIRRLGYPIRWNHLDFFKRFRVIVPALAGDLSKSKETATALMVALGVKMPMQAQIGLTKAFLKQELANELEDRRNNALTDVIIKLQIWWRGVQQRAHFVEKRQNSIMVQQWWRYAIACSTFKKKSAGGRKIQDWFRMVKQMKHKKFLAEEKRRKEEAKRKKEEEERKKRIEKYGREKVEAEEAVQRELEQAKNAEEIAKFRALLEAQEAEEAAEEKKKKKKKKKKKLTRTGSILMDRNEILEIPIDIDGRITVGIGWKGGQKQEMDASCLMFRYKEHRDDVYKYKPRSKDGGVTHRGGWAGGLKFISTNEGSDIQQLDVNLNKISSKINTLIFVVTLFTAGATFDSLEDAYVRLIGTRGAKEYCRYTLTSSGNENAKIMCKLYRHGYSGWRIKAIGHPGHGRLYKHMIAKVNPFLDPQPPRRRFKVKVHRGRFDKVKGKIDADGLNTYCQLRFDLDSAKSKIAKKTAQPIWKSTHQLSGHATNIELSVWHKRGISKQICIGRCVIDCKEFMKVAQQWFKFEDEESALCTGELKVSINEV